MNLWKKLFRIEPKELSPAELERRKSKLELARRSLVEFIGSGDLREVKELVNDNRDVVLTRDEDGLTPLHRATVRGDKDIAKFLLAKGADKNATDKKGKTPLHHAVWWQKKEMVRFLVDNGAEVDARDEYGTPLHLAIGMRNHNAGVRSFQTIVELLQRRGAIGPDNVRFQNMGAIKPRRLGAPVMGFKCFIGGHTWSRCKCSACGKTRDEEHDWSGCKCSACGKTRDSSHQWGPTLGPCMRCGAIHEAQPFINVIADPTGLDPTKTKDAALKLKGMLSDEVLARVIELLKSESFSVRSKAADTLGVIRDKRAVGPLTEILLELPVLDTVSAAAALSALGDKSAAPALIKALKDPSWVRRAQAAKALWFLGDQSATEALAELVMLPVSAEAEMDHIEGRAKVAALRAIRSKGDRRAVPALLKAVSSPCAKIRDEAIQTLKYFPDVVFERPNCAKGHWFEHGKCGVCGLIRRHHSGFTDLHLAIHKDFSHYKIRMLCENGLVNIGDEVGFTPLMKAAGPEGNLTIVKLLVQLGADINAESRRGASALSMAALHDKQDVVQYLKECGAKGGFSIRTRSSSGDSVKRY